ncbi:Ethionine resistance-conferring protein 1 [Cyberlindnera fabianii]|uniref:Ethionine resistance-conferring protein 1 n=1 Tax=Cyberlindnera fabianii TaxID=36022 RepID=A0A1V2L839_CYBFA|nr:Ethionine resistance-conferring protein 1 [Cyberlindnera fabianii]
MTESTAYKPLVSDHPYSPPGYGSVTDSFSSSPDELSLSNEPVVTKLGEAVSIIKASIPMIITFFLQYSLTVVSIFSVGHIGKTELAAVSLSTMTFNITVSIFNGMATCLDTFCSQAYGAGKYKLVGLHFQRCTAMILFMAIPVNIIWWTSGTILGWFVPNKELTDLAQLYLRVISLGSPGYILFETGKRFLQAQGIFHAAQYVLFFCTPFNAVLNYILVWDPTFGIGFVGAPLATAISYTLMAALLLCYVVFIDGDKCWNGLRVREACKNWGPMASLALPGVVMVEAEFLAFEVLTISASKFGTETLAAQSILSTTATLTFQIPFGVSVVGATKIAGYVGSKAIGNAKTAVNVSILISLGLGLITTTSLFLGRFRLVKLFTTDEKVCELGAAAVRILAVNQLYDTINVVAAGCLRGQGRQIIGSNLNLAAYYLVALPLAFYLAFWRDWKLLGLWTGLGCGIFVLAMSEIWFVLNANWKRISEEAEKRNDHSPLGH